MQRILRREALFITQYYRPEMIGSGPFCGDLAEWLNQKGYRVTVLTGQPHYPLGQSFPGYRPEGPAREVLNGVRVERLDSCGPKRAGAALRIVSDLRFLMKGMTALLRQRVARR